MADLQEEPEARVIEIDLGQTQQSESGGGDEEGVTADSETLERTVGEQSEQDHVEEMASSNFTVTMLPRPNDGGDVTIASASELNETQAELPEEEEEEEKEEEREREGGGEEGKEEEEGTEGERDSREEKAAVSQEPLPEVEGAEEKRDEEWVDILGNGELMKKILRQGDGVSSRPTPQCRVKLRTRGVVEGGSVIDRHNRIQFTVGDGDVIQAWDISVALMERGELAQVKTTGRFAYGEQGRDPDVPPNASITYELELVEVQEPIDYHTVSEEDLLSLVDKKRVRGNELFQRKDFGAAINSYQKALQMVDIYFDEHGNETSPDVKNMQIRCWNNLAAAQLKGELHREALKSCENVLNHDPNNVKALFRSGKVLAAVGELDRAVRNLEKAARLSPNEKAIQTELQRTSAKRDRSKQQEKAMYRRMVEGVGKEPTAVPPATQSEPAEVSWRDRWGPWPYLAIAGAVAAVGIGLAYFLTQRH